MPLLVQYGALTPEHFAEHPVWVACHCADYDEPWYDDTDEATFRPWDGPLPVAPEDGMFLVRAMLHAKDGTRYAGFLTPAPRGDVSPMVLGAVQPQLFLPSGEQIGFWLGMTGKPAAAGLALTMGLGKPTWEVFPITFAAEPGLAVGVTEGRVLGFYACPDGTAVQVVV